MGANVLTPEARKVRLGAVLEGRVPLGPLAEVAVEGHAAIAGSGVLHGDANCLALQPGSRHVHSLLAGARLCGACAWLLEEGHPLCRFAEVVTQVKTPAVAPAETAAVDSADHAAVFATRGRTVLTWRRAQTAVLLGCAGVREYTWLEQWAEPMITAKAVVAERARIAVVPLADPDDLLAAACVALMEPGQLGSVLPPSSTRWGVDGEDLLRQAWWQWQAECARGVVPVARSLAVATSTVHTAFGRQRKGRDEASDAVRRLITPLIEQALQQTQAQRSLPGLRCDLVIPPLTAGTWPQDQGDPLTPWQARALAAHQVEVDWRSGRAVLQVPPAVAEQLKSG